MSPRWGPPIPLATKNLSCRRDVKDLTCRRYTANEMIAQSAFSYDPATSQARNALCRFLDLDRSFDPARAGLEQPEPFVESYGGKVDDISIHGQESNATTRRLPIMYLAIRGIEADIEKGNADTFSNLQHPDLHADYVLANHSRGRHLCQNATRNLKKMRTGALFKNNGNILGNILSR